MKIVLHSGTDAAAVRAVQAALHRSRAVLAGEGVLYPRTLGSGTQAGMALAALPLRHGFVAMQGIADAGVLSRHVARLADALGAEIAAHRPAVTILSAVELARWCGTAERMAALLRWVRDFSDDVTGVLHLAMQAEAEADQAVAEVMLGSLRPTGAVDQAGLVRLWQRALAPEAVRVVPSAAEGLVALLGPERAAGMAIEPRATPRPSAASLARFLAVNRALQSAGAVPGALRAGVMGRVQVPGPPLRAEEIAGLRADAGFDAKAAVGGVAEAAARLRAEIAAEFPAPEDARLSPAAEGLLSETAKAVWAGLLGGRYWPRNSGVVGFDESREMAPLPVAPPVATGTVVIACMKDEGPYILEWVAHHLALGVDRFVIFSNDCSDGTDAILDRLAVLGHVVHLRNDDWAGNSPQQAALNRALTLPVVQEAAWLIHIDVDEYINIRGGDGSLAWLYAAMGDASHLAMTWRLFGIGGAEEVEDARVMARSVTCAPAYCPKPHTAWGFKTIGRNIGAYGKLSGHRPNQLLPGMEGAVRWLNGSLRDVTAGLAKNGWRSSIASIGYDVVQLNHYALRSRQSFLIKRQRGRALHVDRSIGFNYWVRHDWNSACDRSILRHVPRMEAMRATLLADAELAALHRAALEWHWRRAAELQIVPEFAALMAQTRGCDLTDGERVAYAVAEDMAT